MTDASHLIERSESPRVSIVIPTYNRAGMVGDAVRSVLAQTVTDLEVIVIDDGSTDDTAAVVEQLAADERVRYVDQPNAGRSAARNRGLDLAQGQFVGFLDSDDLLEPWAIAAHLEVFDCEPNVGMTVAGYLVVDHDAVVDERMPWLSAGSLDLAGWLFDCYGMPGSVLHRREWMERVDGFDVQLEMAEDWDLYLRLAAEGCPMRFVHRVVCRYRQHEANSVQNVERHWRASRFVVERVFERRELPADVLAQEKRALSWVDLVFARKGFRAGAMDLAIACLGDALSRDPEVAAMARHQWLAFLLAPWNGEKTLDRPAIREIARAMHAGPRDVRRARADAHMARFFRAAQLGRWPSVRQSLAAGLRMDPRWLFNRGVLKLGLMSLAAVAVRPPEPILPLPDRASPKAVDS